MIDPNIVVAAITTAGAIATAFIVRAQKRRIDEVHEQVKNTHTSNLRDDVDKLIEFNQLALREIAALRTDLQLERQERIALDARFQEEESNS